MDYNTDTTQLNVNARDREKERMNDGAVQPINSQMIVPAGGNQEPTNFTSSSS